MATLARLNLRAHETSHAAAVEARQEERAAGAGAAAPAPDGASAPVAAKSAEPSAASDYIKSIVFGGLDGIVTTFAIVASVVGANYSLKVVLVTGFAKLLGDGLAMGIGDAMSESAEQKHILGERQREVWEYANYAAGEVTEMVEIYKAKGIEDKDAKRIMQILTSKPAYEKFFIDHMMQQELGHVVPGEDDNPVKDGAVTFASFMVWGSIPLWPYVAYYTEDYNNGSVQFGVCIGITLACLLGLGAMQAWILKQNPFKQAVLMAINGSIAAAAAYGVGYGLQQAVTYTAPEGGCM